MGLAPDFCREKTPLLFIFSVLTSTGSILQYLEKMVYYQTLITVFYWVYCALFYIENDAEIFPAHYKWEVTEKGFKMAFMMSKLAIINSCEMILEK